MIDYLLRFPDPAAALTAFSMPEAVEGAAPPPAWADERGRAVMLVQVYRVLDPGDEDTPATLEHAEGFWLAVATTARRPSPAAARTPLERELIS